MPKVRRSMRQRANDEKIIKIIRQMKAKKTLAFMDLVVQIKREIQGSHSAWKGTGVAIGGWHFVASTAERAQVQAVGNVHGCHECNTKVATDTHQPFIGDHIPPINLKASEAKKVRMALSLNPGEYRLYPHCDACASQQAALVRSGRVTGLSTKETKLIRGGSDNAWHYIKTRSTHVGPSTTKIQNLGQINGCHSCGTKYPASVYHADHCPPQSFHRHDVALILEAAGIDLPASNLRPHCPKCSHGQGGRTGAANRGVNELKALAERRLNSYPY